MGVKAALTPYLPAVASLGQQSKLQMKAFHGNFGVMVKALAYLKALGAENLRAVAEHAVLNANYLMKRLKDMGYTPAHDVPCMHEFVLTLTDVKDTCGVSALDVAKSLIDHGMHPPTMYFPIIVHEALMFEPTETETRETLDHVVDVMAAILARVKNEPEALHTAPHSSLTSKSISTRWTLKRRAGCTRIRCAFSTPRTRPCRKWLSQRPS